MDCSTWFLVENQSKTTYRLPLGFQHRRYCGESSPGVPLGPLGSEHVGQYVEFCRADRLRSSRMVCVSDFENCSLVSCLLRQVDTSPATLLFSILGARQLLLFLLQSSFTAHNSRSFQFECLPSFSMGSLLTGGLQNFTRL